jgi:hypothetical protein
MQSTIPPVNSTAKATASQQILLCKPSIVQKTPSIELLDVIDLNQEESYNYNNTSSIRKVDLGGDVPYVTDSMKARKLQEALQFDKDNGFDSDDDELSDENEFYYQVENDLSRNNSFIDQDDDDTRSMKSSVSALSGLSNTTTCCIRQNYKKHSSL